MKQAKKHRRDSDSPWKDALMTFFQEFMELCFPAIAVEIDWSRGITFLDKEFRAITKDAVISKRTVDKLVKVYKKDGTEIFVLIHIEIQGQKEEQFPERMYVYQYRLFDRHHVPIVSLAVLIDSNKKWRPNVYQTSMWGTELTFKYNMIKILDFQDKREFLEQSNNAFAIVILAQLAAIDLAKKRNTASKLAVKLALTQLLFAKGWQQPRVNHLLKFIDWLILLPTKLVIEYESALLDFSEEPYMAYVTQYQRFLVNRDKGQWLQEGELKGQRETQLTIAKQLLAKGQTTAFVAEITGLEETEIDSLIKDTQH